MNFKPLISQGIESPGEAEAVFWQMAEVFLKRSSSGFKGTPPVEGNEAADKRLPDPDARYRALVEQIPAVVFMACPDRGIGEAYVSPQIESLLGFSQEEWLEDPVRWYRQIHPEDKLRWSTEIAQMFLSGEPLRSTCRVMARDEKVVWFHCEARIMHQPNGQPDFVHGVAFDITDLKTAERALREEQEFSSAILRTVGALVVVTDASGRIVQFNHACERLTGYTFEQVRNQPIWKLLVLPEERNVFKRQFEQFREDQVREQYESRLRTSDGEERLVSWSNTVLRDGSQVSHIIATGIDVTESKRLEKAILDVSAQEQRRIGRDLHDGLGQHLTGIAFLAKALEGTLEDQSLPAASDAAKLVSLANEAIQLTRNLSKGLRPLIPEAGGLMTALERLAVEVEDLFSISCTFHCPEPVLIYDQTTATHLYQITQESVTNATRHGSARSIEIRLTAGTRDGVLRVTDNGSGIPGTAHRGGGMGLHIMKHRASLIGALLLVQRGHYCGTVVTCSFPLPPAG